MKLTHSISAGVLVLGLLAFESCKQEIGGKQTAEGEMIDSTLAYATATQNGIETNSVIFEKVQYKTDNGSRDLLLKKVIATKQDSAVFHVSVTDIAANKPLWKNSFKATSADVENNLLVALTEGEGEDQYTYYNISTGEELIRFSYGDLRVKIPSSQVSRYIGFLTADHIAGAASNLIGELTYATQENKKQTVQIFRKDTSAVLKEALRFTPDMGFETAVEKFSEAEDGQTLLLLGVDKTTLPKSITDFSIQLIYYIADGNRTIINIPVISDELAIGKASLENRLFSLKLK
jgi:hypothetical protein